MSQTIVLDTNILIDFLRSNDRAIAYVDSLNEDIPVLISVITAAELFAGVQGAAEMNHLSSVLDLYEIIPIDTSLAQKGGLIKNEFFKSHGTGIGMQ